MSDNTNQPGPRAARDRRRWVVAALTLAVNLGSFLFLVLVARSSSPGVFGGLAALAGLALLFDVPANALQVAVGDRAAPAGGRRAAARLDGAMADGGRGLLETVQRPRRDDVEQPVVGVGRVDLTVLAEQHQREDVDVGRTRPGPRQLPAARFVGQRRRDAVEGRGPPLGRPSGIGRCGRDPDLQPRFGGEIEAGSRPAVGQRTEHAADQELGQRLAGAIAREIAEPPFPEVVQRDRKGVPGIAEILPAEAIADLKMVAA